MDKLSIIIPMFNCEKYIIKCLESIKKQKYSNYEVLLINDGSIDSTEIIVKDYIRENNLKNFFYFYKDNSGPSSSRNLGITMSKGNWIAFVDADDYIGDTFFEEAMKIIKENTDLEWLIGNFSYIINDKIINNKKFYIPKEDIKDEIIINIFNNKLTNYKIDSLRNIWGKLYRRDIIIDNNIKFNEEISFFEDGIFNIKYIDKINKIKFIDLCCYIYNYNLNSLTHTYSKKRFMEDEMKVKFIENLCINNNDRINIAKQLFYYDMFCSSMSFSLFSKQNRMKFKDKIKIMKKVVDNQIYNNLNDYYIFKYSNFSKKILYLFLKCKMYYLVGMFFWLNSERRK